MKDLTRCHITRHLERFIQANNYNLTKPKLINIGSGNQNRYSELLNRFKVVAIDLLPVHDNANPGDAENFEYIQMNAELLKFPDSSFDIAISIECFEHITHPDKAALEMFRVLRNGSKAFISVPTINTWIAEFGKHGHYFSKFYLKEMFEAAGFTSVNISSCGGIIYFFAFVARSWLSIFGYRIFGKHWWIMLNFISLPIFSLSIYLDPLLPFFPTHHIITVRKI